MNIEDRLKDAFEQEAEHLHAPHGSPETAVRRGRRRRAANLMGGTALVLTLIGGTAAGVQLLGDTEEPEQGNLAAATVTTQAGNELTTVQSNAQAMDFAWERVTLPRSGVTNVWNMQVAFLDDRFVAVGIGFDEGADLGPSAEQVLVWASTDGTEWALTSSVSPFDGPVDTLLSTGEGFVAVVRSSEGSNDATRVFSSTDGTSWIEGSADLGSLNDNQFIWFGGAAAGNGVTVLSGVLQTEPPQPPIVLEAAGVVLQQNMRDGTYAVSDLATGEAITTIDGEVVFGGGAGITVRDADGEVILVVSWEALEEADTLNQREDGFLRLEQDGISLELDYESNIYVATDLATGEVVASGDQDALYRSPRLQIIHPDTGETIVDIDMDDFYRAQEESWNANSGYEPQTELLLLATSDGEAWDRVALASGSAEELNVSGMGYGPQGFLLSVNRFGPNNFGMDLWRSADGRDWELLSSSEEPVDGPIVSRGDAYYRISYGRQSGIGRSADGINWTTVHEADARGTYYNSLAAGGLGVIAIGQDQEETYGPPIVIAKDGRTLAVDSRAGRITVTDDASGEVLTTIELDVYEVEPPEQIQYDEENQTITVTDAEGNVVMVFTEEEADAASIEAEVDYEYSTPEPAVAYSPDGERWFAATTAGLDIGWAQGLAVGDSAVVIVGDSADFYAELQSGSSGEVTVALGDGSTTELTTVPADPYGLPRETYVWVGRPR